jgi:hypothetical protein
LPWTPSRGLTIDSADGQRLILDHADPDGPTERGSSCSPTMIAKQRELLEPPIPNYDGRSAARRR